MADPVAASDTVTDNTDVARFYTEKANGGFRAIAEARVAHSANMTVADKGKLPYVDASGEIAFLAASTTDGDLIKYVSSIPTAFTPTYATKAGAETLENKKHVDSTTSFVDNADATKEFKLQVSNITTETVRTMTVPDYDFTVASLAGAELFQNKELEDSTTYIVGNADNTKRGRFQASGITTETDRDYDLPNKSGTVALVSDIGFDHLVTTNTPSAAATIDFTSTVFSTDFDFYVFKIRKLFEGVQISSLLNFRLSVDGGSNYIATGYDYMTEEVAGTTRTDAAPSGQNQVAMMATSFGSGGGGTTLYPGVTGELVVYTNPFSGAGSGDTNNECTFMWRLYQYRNGTQYRVEGQGRIATSARVNGLRFFPSAGNSMNGIITAYGGRNS